MEEGDSHQSLSDRVMEGSIGLGIASVIEQVGRLLKAVVVLVGVCP